MAIFGDFLVVDYKIKEKVGDLSIETKEQGALIIYGYNSIFNAIDIDIGRLKEGQEMEKELNKHEAFGERDLSLVKTYPLSAFANADIREGQTLEFKGPYGPIQGTVKKIEAGRVTIDFNHPLAGKSVIVKVKLRKVIKDEIEKIKAFFKFAGLEVINVDREKKVVTIAKIDDKKKEEINYERFKSFDFPAFFPEYTIEEVEP
ncbi:MAG: hypothetical protein QXS91_01355 [Candidatus Anstonellales archaeon]